MTTIDPSRIPSEPKEVELYSLPHKSSISQYLPGSPDVNELKIKNTPLTLEHVNEIALFFLRHRNLRNLTLRKTELNAEKVQCLIPVIDCSTCLGICLSDNELGNEGIKIIADAFSN